MTSIPSLSDERFLTVDAADRAQAVLAEEAHRLGVPPRRAQHVRAGAATSARIVPDGAAADGDAAHGAPTEGEASDGQAAHRGEDAQRQAAEAEQARGQPA